MLPSFRTFALDSQLIVVPPRQPRSVKLSQPAGFGEFGFLPMPQIQPGFEVLLVDPRQTKHAPGRPKTDVVDCQCARPEKILDRRGAFTPGAFFRIPFGELDSFLRTRRDTPTTPGETPPGASRFPLSPEEFTRIRPTDR